ncbi:histone-like nucleoid-structuring protein Lsr2 [Pseudonocardia sp. NPDC046786]|uniref:histone-like nucleoid-structuring protein Lsr2 n=1 Tax=Pseudonocardia sp. NPDC046786 TaxID=3155471 RepID=UPI0033CFD5C7
MAKVETTRLVDDITGGDADETLDFGLDGIRFEIDLSAGNARRLREELAPFLAAARPAGAPRARRAAGPASTARTASRAPTGQSASTGPRPGADGDPAVREQNRAVRVWAREHGYAVSERGRIPSGVVEAYRRGGQAAADPVPDTGAEPAPSGGESGAGHAAPGGPFAPATPFGSAPDPASGSGSAEAGADPDRRPAPAVRFSG